MKKRIFCLALCMLMTVSGILTSCGKSKDEAVVETDAEGNPVAQATSIKPITLTFTAITDKKTTPEAIAAVEEELNKLTKAEFKTQIKLQLYTEDEYDSVIDKKVEEIKAQLEQEKLDEEAKKEAAKKAKEEAKKNPKKKSDTTKNEDETTEAAEETMITSTGKVELKYPELKGTQLDIFLIRGLDNMVKYDTAELLAPLDEELNLTAKILKKYVYPTFLDAAKIGGKTVAIPNNHTIGEYKYLLLNKELVDKYSYDADDLKTLADCESFLADVAKNEAGIIPLLNKVDPSMEYIGKSPSILGAFIPNTMERGAKAVPKNIFGITQFTSHLVSMDKYEKLNYIPSSTPAEDAEFAVAIKTGDAASPEQWTDKYYVNIYEKPRATSENTLNSMFAVSTYTKDVKRCLEIITYLNTNSEIRNLLQYGIENVNYELNEDDGTLKRKNNDYMMDLYDTGNVFIAYPEEGMPLNIWELGKKQNLDSIISPYIGFNPENKDNKKMITDLEKISAEYIDKLNSYTGDDLETFIADTATEMGENTIIKEALDAEGENSIASIYTAWQASAFPAPEAAPAEAAPAA